MSLGRMSRNDQPADSQPSLAGYYGKEKDLV